MGTFGLVAYCTAFCFGYAGALVWILERRDKKYRQGTVSFTDAFLAGALAIILIYISSMAAFMRWGGKAFLYDAALIAALAAFGAWKEISYRGRAAKAARRQ